MAAATDAREHPNIVFILAHDPGLADVHCLNPDRCKIATPHLGRLAMRGMRFTDAHSGLRQAVDWAWRNSDDL